MTMAVRASQYRPAQQKLPDLGFQPLNERLYRLLLRRFGKVKVANQGEAMVGQATFDPSGRARWTVGHSGEYYRVACPYCDDRKHRLWINHRYGLYEPTTDSSFNWLAICYRCHFEKRYNLRKELDQWLFGFMNRSERARLFQVAEGVIVDPQNLAAARLPGVTLPLDQLPANHPAVEYAQSRGFDVQEAAEAWGASYCLEAYAPFELATHRLILPVWFHGQMVGWQARALGDGYGPKYYTMPGLKKSKLLYNYDRAVESRIVVLVEGALDAWKVGLPAVAMFGKTLARDQKAVLLGGWPRTRDPLLVVMLDPEAEQEAEEIMAECAEAFPHRRVKVRLPAGEDPGSLTRDEIWDFIEAAASGAGLDLGDFLEAEK